MMNHANLKKWKGTAWALESPLDKLPVPGGALHGEAADVARFLHLYWEPQPRPDGTTCPGLSSAVTSGRFGPDIREEILELLDAYQSSEVLARLADVPVPPAPVDEARALIATIRDAVEWHGNVVGDEAAVARAQTLDKKHDGAHSHDALAAALYDYAGLAEMYEKKIVGIFGFDACVISRARETGRELRERPPHASQHELRDDARRALELRNRIATLLYDRMQLVRAAARIVFRGQQDILSEVASTYYRERRAARRRRSANGASAEKTAGG